jgi:pseudouridine-5'-phosphate glycosidase
VPATVGIVAGRVVIGLSDADLELFARSDQISKVSRRDLAVVLARKEHGATTVAGSMICAARAGIRVLATGGIGGVHRGAEITMDVSADISELARSGVAVVCSGAKSILDIGKTLEVLETHGVPVIAYRSDRFPAFHARDSGYPIHTRVDTPEAAAAIVAAQLQSGLGGGVVIANPIPEQSAIESARLDGWIETALAEAGAEGVGGGALTPFVLDRLAGLSRGRTLDANKALLGSNAALAAQIAVALEKIPVDAT